MVTWIRLKEVDGPFQKGECLLKEGMEAEGVAG